MENPEERGGKAGAHTELQTWPRWWGFLKYGSLAAAVPGASVEINPWEPANRKTLEGAGYLRDHNLGTTGQCHSYERPSFREKAHGDRA